MVTIKEIARTVGVSSATVSRVLNFDATLSVTADKRRAIIETAEALNYATPRNRQRAAQPALSAVALVHFLRPDQELVDPYYVAMRLGIERRCEALRVETIKVYKPEAEPEPRAVQDATGVIVIGKHDDAAISWIGRYNRNAVFADYVPDSDECDSVACDVVHATRKLLGALDDMGYRRIGFIGWQNDAAGTAKPTPEKRYHAYLNWMGERGRFDPGICLIEANSERSGYQLTRRMLAEAGPLDALVTGNDNMAVGAYRAIHEAGLSIPHDLAVASFNDIPVAQFLNPPLSTVRLPAEEIGETAVELLVERLAGRELAKRVTLASTLVWRGSTRAPTPVRDPG